MGIENPRYQGIKFENAGHEKVEDQLTIEEALQIDINRAPFTVIMQSPGAEIELVRGLLFTEDLYRHEKDFQFEEVAKNELNHLTHVNVNIEESLLGRGYLNVRSLLSVSSCGICGKRELGDLKVDGSKLKSNETIDISNINLMFRAMENVQTNFRKTGGSHCAASFDTHGELLTIMEDIGRHNAVDKAIGSLIMKGFLDSAKTLLVSGRISYEIVTKAFMARIPILAAVSAPSSLAVDYAKELGITLFAFSRNGKTTCYAHPERISLEKSKEVA